MNQRQPKWHTALQGLTHAQVESIHSDMIARSVGARATLFREGEPSDSILVIRNGRVRLYLCSEGGEEFTLNLVTGGSILGLAAAVLGRPRVLNAESIGRVDASVMSRASLVSFMRQMPRFAENITGILALLAVENIERSGPLVMSPAKVRLASILLAVANLDDSRDKAGRELVVGLTQEDLAKLLGTTRTWVALTLRDFENQRLIEKLPGHIAICDVAALASIGHGHLRPRPGRQGKE